jgi:lysosomal alpha-glucosidase
MSMDKAGHAMGFFLLNSNAMGKLHKEISIKHEKIISFLTDIVLQPYPAITFMTIGGILDFFVYMGPTPNDVISQHMLTIGLPFMPPYFSLG